MTYSKASKRQRERLLQNPAREREGGLTQNPATERERERKAEREMEEASSRGPSSDASCTLSEGREGIESISEAGSNGGDAANARLLGKHNGSGSGSASMEAGGLKTAAAAAAASLSSVAANLPEELRAKLALASMLGDTSSPETRRHVFWETQPVAQFTERRAGLEKGPIVVTSVDQVKSKAYPLPSSFEWCDCDVTDEHVLNEVYDLLANNYVEDDDNMFRFAYPKAFLRWALQPPGYRVEWHLGVRVKSSGKLVAFITGIPATVVIDGAEVPMAEINFLCIHKKLRSKRLAPVLIKEITRKVNLRGVWQATYTAGTVLPRPIASCRYYHRSLNPKKLIDIGFSKLQPRMTMARTVKLYSVADTPATPGLRLMEERDVAQVRVLLAEFLERFRLYPRLDEDEVRHWLLSRPEVVTSYVITRPKSAAAASAAKKKRKKKKKKTDTNAEDVVGAGDDPPPTGSDGDATTSGTLSDAGEANTVNGDDEDEEGGGGNDHAEEGEEVTDFISFYCLPSTIIGNERYKVLKAAYLYYYVCNTVSLKTLLGDALIMAKKDDFDVFNALDIMQNKVGKEAHNNDNPLKELKFGIGDGNLQYYLYNWRVENDLVPSKVGLVLL